jgi:hypothetical protein
MPQTEQSEIHKDNSDTKNASTFGPVQSSDSTANANQEPSSSGSRDDTGIK